MGGQWQGRREGLNASVGSGRPERDHHRRDLTRACRGYGGAPCCALKAAMTNPPKSDLGDTLVSRAFYCELERITSIALHNTRCNMRPFIAGIGVAALSLTGCGGEVTAPHAAYRKFAVKRPSRQNARNSRVSTSTAAGQLDSDSHVCGQHSTCTRLDQLQLSCLLEPLGGRTTHCLGRS